MQIDVLITTPQQGVMQILLCIVDLLRDVMQITSAKLYLGYGDLGCSV